MITEGGEKGCDGRYGVYYVGRTLCASVETSPHQADLTKLNGVNILTMEDDNARKGWALALEDAHDITVIAGMKHLVKIKYDNLLTDIGTTPEARYSGQSNTNGYEMIIKALKLEDVLTITQQQG